MAILKRSSILLTITCFGILVLLGTIAPPHVQAKPLGCVAGPHSVLITSDQSWCAIDNPHLVNAGVTVISGVTLTIEPGVIINFNYGTTLNIAGNLVALGTATQHITFISTPSPHNPGDWISLSFLNTSAANLSYVDVADAGLNDGRAIYVVSGASFQMHHSRIHDTLGRGLWLEGQGLNATLDDLEIDHNTTDAILQTTVDMTPSYTNIHMHDNGLNALLINGDNVRRNVILDGSPAALKGAPIYLNSTVWVNPFKTLTITPGTTIKCAHGASIEVESGGTLNVPGTQALPVNFTSQAITPAPGDWLSLSFLTGSTANLSYMDVGYAGLNNGRAIYVVPGANFQIHHSRIHHTAGRGLWLEGQGLNATLDDLEIDHNTMEAILQTTVDMTPTFTNIHLHHNGLDALRIESDLVRRNVTLDGSPTALNGAPIYLGPSSVTVTPGKTLTVIAGSVLKFAGGASLQVQSGGTLNVPGTQALPATFTSQAITPAPGDWLSLSFLAGSTANLSYMDVGYAGLNDGRAIYVVSGANFQIHHSRIHHTIGRGLWLEGQGLNATLADIEIDHNTLDAILQTTPDMTPTYNNIRLHDNNLNALLITGDYIHRNVTLDGSPTALNGAPIVIGGNYLGVTNGNILSVTPGTTIKFASGLGILVQGGGTLNAIGTPALPITFTSLSAVPAPGGWDKLNFDTGSSAILAYCDVAYAGVNDYAIIVRSPTVQIRQCRIHHSLHGGFFISGAHVTLINDAIYDNAWAGVALISSGNLTGMHNTLARNGTGAYVDESSQMDLTNTILANNNTGINVDAGGSAAVYYTLWDSNVTPVQGVVTDIHPFSGHAAFAADGYHITLVSDAAHRGMDLGIIVDIDGEPRAQPAYTAPDLGADEINTLYNFYLPAVMKK